MPTEKELTGYPSIDKPWLKYHIKKSVDFDVNATLYNNFKRVANQSLNELAIINYRTCKKTTFSELLSKIDEFANGLTALGVSKTDKIVALTINSFIDPIAVLGTNKVGAVIEFLDPESDISQLQRHTQNAKILIVEGIFQPLARLICNNIPVVVYNSSALMPEDNYIAYDEFIKNGAKVTSEVNYDVSLPAIIIFSSGSTGAPKPIVHSNFSVNSAILKMMMSDFPLFPSNMMAKTIPSYIGLGVVTSMLVAIMSGMPYIQVSTIEEGTIDFGNCSPDAIPVFLVSEALALFVNYINWLKDNNLKNYGLIIFAAPIFFKALLAQEKIITDMSFIKAILLGGSKMSMDELALMEKVFGSKGLSVPIGIGYGQNELCGAVALNTVNHNKNGSAGYPVFETNIKIVNRDTYEEVEYNQEGLILEQSDSAFVYYDNMPEETEKTKITLPDGTEWYNSNDLGYMDDDGFLYITGRINRVVIKSDHKVSLDVVELKIKNIQGIVDVAVVPLANSAEDGDTVAFVVANNENITLEFINNPRHGLTVFETPVKLVILDELPRMNNSKVDYRALEKEAEKL